jgi:hypothetical protein
VQVAVDLFVALHKLGAPGEGGAALWRGQHGKQIVGQLFEAVQNAIQLGGAELLGAGNGGDVATQLLEAVIADGDAEILPGYVLDFVRFVEHHRVIFGQDAAFGITILQHLLQRQIGEEQVMVDDHDVAGLGALVHQGEEAALVLLALLAGAKIAAGVDLGPGSALFRQLLDLRAVADFGGLLPGLDHLEIGDFLQAGQHCLAVGVVNLLAAGIVVAALHIADAQGAREMLLQEGDVLEEELFLQILGAGGNHNAFAGKDRGHQVSQRFAGARAGFRDQMFAVGQRGFHRFGHG